MQVVENDVKFEVFDYQKAKDKIFLKKNYLKNLKHNQNDILKI